MSRYRKKPVIVDAVQMPSSSDEYFDLTPLAQCPQWLQQAVDQGAISRAPGDGWHVNTLEGRMLARPGDYLIRGTKGEFYPCKADIFAEIYEAV